MTFSYAVKELFIRAVEPLGNIEELSEAQVMSVNFTKIYIRNELILSDNALLPEPETPAQICSCQIVGYLITLKECKAKSASDAESLASTLISKLCSLRTKLSRV